MQQDGEPLFIFATIKPRPEFFELASGALNGLIEPTLSEAGCRLFSVFESNDDPGSLHLFECFEDAHSLSQHYEMPYTKNVFQLYEQWLSEPVRIIKLSASEANTLEQFK